MMFLSEVREMDKLREEIGLLKLIFGLVFIPFVSLTGWLFGQVAENLPRNISDIDWRTICKAFVDIGSDVPGFLALAGVSATGFFLLLCLVEIRLRINAL